MFLLAESMNFIVLTALMVRMFSTVLALQASVFLASCVVDVVVLCVD